MTKPIDLYSHYVYRFQGKQYEPTPGEEVIYKGVIFKCEESKELCSDCDGRKYGFCMFVKCWEKNLVLKRGYTKYRDLTPEQKSYICNGCGGKGGKIKPPQFRFRASCNHHDFLYSRGYTRWHRLKADYLFAYWLMRDAGWRFWLYPAVVIYFFMVRLFGWSFFHYGDREQTLEEMMR